MDMTPLFDRLTDELALPNVDLSPLLARIQIACIQLDIMEPGKWWDEECKAAILTHSAITDWMSTYRFESVDDMGAGALDCLAGSLERFVAKMDQQQLAPVAQ